MPRANTLLPPLCLIQIPATLKEVWNIAVTGYGLKFFIAAAITPLLYVSRDFLQTRYGLDPMPVEAIAAEARGGRGEVEQLVGEDEDQVI